LSLLELFSKPKNLSLWGLSRTNHQTILSNFSPASSSEALKDWLLLEDSNPFNPTSRFCLFFGRDACQMIFSHLLGDFVINCLLKEST